MIANSQLAVQPAAVRSVSTANKTVEGASAEEGQSGFKEMLEQGLQSPKGEKSEQVATKESKPVKRLTHFETHAEFVDQPLLTEAGVETDAQTGELTVALIDVNVDVNVPEETEITVEAKVSAELNEGVAKQLDEANLKGNADDTVQSIVKSLMRDGNALSRMGNVAEVAQQQVSDRRPALSVEVDKKSMAVQADSTNTMRIVGANQFNALPANTISNSDMRRLGFDLDAQTSIRDVLGNLSFRGSEGAETEGQLSAGFAELKNTTLIPVTGAENRTVPTKPVKQTESLAMAGMQATAQVATSFSDAPPPVKDQVLDRLGPELRNMQKAETTSSAQAQASGVAASNRNVISLQLYPIGLGRVQARLTREGDSVKIDLLVETKQTLDLLNADIDALKTSLRALGASESNINIALGRGNNNANQEAALEKGEFSNSGNDKSGDSDANGKNNQDHDSDIDSRLAAQQTINDNDRVGYDSSRIII